MFPPDIVKGSFPVSHDVTAVLAKGSDEMLEELRSCLPPDFPDAVRQGHLIHSMNAAPVGIQVGKLSARVIAADYRCDGEG